MLKKSGTALADGCTSTSHRTALGRTATLALPRLIPFGSTMISLQREEENEMDATATVVRRGPWNKGKLVGQKAPLKVKDIWAIRVRLQIQAHPGSGAIRPGD